MSEHVETIRRDLACPQCDYNLRGLSGDVVECPECGMVCDVARLVSMRWTRPWHEAPRLMTASLPAAWLYAALLVLLFYLPFSGRGGDTWMRTTLIIFGAFGGWIGLMAYVHHTLGGVEGLLTASLGHLAALLMVGGAICFLAGLVSFAFLSPTLVLLPAGMVAWYFGRKAERAMGERCIRFYLNRKLVD